MLVHDCAGPCARIVGGHGESDKPHESLDMAGYVRSIVDLLDAEQIKVANFVGLSWGGQVVQEIAIDYPERVDKLGVGRFLV